jgi:TonB family protein
MTARVTARRLAACVTLLLAACSRHAPNPQVDAAVAAFDEQLTQLDHWRASLGGTVTGTPAAAQKDFRGRTIDDDLDRWVLSAATRREIKDLRDRAAAANYPADAQQLLRQASHLADDAATRGKQVWTYWNGHLPAPYWRRYWHDLYAANGLPDETPDSMLTSIESRISRSLERADFAGAGTDADELDAVFAEALSRATTRIYKAREQPVDLAARKTACPRDRVRPRGERPALVRGDAVESFYPQDAIRRGEAGSVVLRAQINAAGCATAVGIQVHSGVPALDAAALSWFETARFAPGSKHGTPIDSSLVWKVRFELQDSAGG